MRGGASDEFAGHPGLDRHGIPGPTQPVGQFGINAMEILEVLGVGNDGASFRMKSCPVCPPHGGTAERPRLASRPRPCAETTGGSPISRMISMPKEKISVTIDAAVLAATDADARSAGLNRSAMIEQALRNEHLRVALQNYTTQTVPALDIDAYAQNVYHANRAARL